MRRILLPLIALLFFATSAFAQFDFPNSPTANQIIAGPAGQAMKWDGTKWVAQFGTVGGPFLPLAGGTMTGPINSVTALGIGTAAISTKPLDIYAGGNEIGYWSTAGLTIAGANTTSNPLTYSLAVGQPIPSDTGWASIFTSGFANANTTGYAGFGLDAGVYFHDQTNGWKVTDPQGDAYHIGANAQAHDVFWYIANGLTPGGYWNGTPHSQYMSLRDNLGAGGAGLYLEQGHLVLSNIASSSVMWGSPTQPVASILGWNGGGSPNIYIGSGTHYDGSEWIADYSSAQTAVINQSGLNFYSNAGMTVGTPYAPTLVANITSGGAFATAQSPTTYPAFDGSGATISVPQGGFSHLVNTFSGLAIITGNNGAWNTCVYACGSSTSTLIGGTNCAPGGTAPTSGYYTIGFTAGWGYSVYNNTGIDPATFGVVLIRTRTQP